MKAVVIGNSHTAMFMQAREGLPSDFLFSFIPIQWYEDGSASVVKLFNEGEAKLVLKEKFRGGSHFASGAIALSDFDLVVLVGICGGPGDCFRTFAPASFVGSLAGVPEPAEVACPVYRPDSLTSENPPISREVLNRICASSYRKSLARWLDPIPMSKPVLIVPTPPMAKGAVTRRFGPGVTASSMGTALVEEWIRATEVIVANRSRTAILSVPDAAMEGGWMRDQYLRVDNPVEFHAGGSYLLLCAAELQAAMRALADH